MEKITNLSHAPSKLWQANLASPMLKAMSSSNKSIFLAFSWSWQEKDIWSALQIAPCMILANPSYPSSVLLALKMEVIADTHLEQSFPWTIAANASTTIVVGSFMLNDDVSSPQRLKWKYTDVHWPWIYRNRIERKVIFWRSSKAYRCSVNSFVLCSLFFG